MATTGLRERKKQQTRAALRSAALRLTAERGLEGVTVEDIAEAADVSPRTFFNYFASKEDAVIGGDAGVLNGIVGALAGRPNDEEPLFSLHAVLREIAIALPAARDLHALRRKVVADNPSLLPRQVAQFVEFENVLVQAVSTRTSAQPITPADAALVVAAAVAALRVSVDLWITEEAGTSLPALFDRAIDRLAAGLISPKTRPTDSLAAAHFSKKTRKTP